MANRVEGSAHAHGKVYVGHLRSARPIRFPDSRVARDASESRKVSRESGANRHLRADC